MSRPARAVAAAALLVTLAACGAGGDGDGDGTAAEPSAARPSEAASQSAPAKSSEAASAQAELIGTWESEGGDLRLALRADDTFTEDLNGKQAAYQGTYKATDDGFTPSADDGARAAGTLVDEDPHPHVELSGYTLHPR
ncbi:Atu4866 domain-containing protein [Streptomyces sp. N35]|uniref:Atu4866 domain-containing protein n=1 Tax=Streptomyces sp. N35 TaxID=2795730 RepID=UPI0018F6B0F4|nr:Atu4866 domain-containing protein [Streptomyces sp. N35]